MNKELHQGQLDMQGATLVCTKACLESILANTIDEGVLLSDLHYAEISNLYHQFLDLQQEIVLGIKRHS